MRVNPGNIIYLDHAAATPMDQAVLTAMQPYFSEFFFNPSSPYEPAVQVRRAYEDARSRLAATTGAKPDELIMTAGATESINLAVSGVNGHIVSSTIEHAAVLENVKQHPHTLVAPQQNGIVDAEDVLAVITDDTELVTISLANSELGTIQPIRRISEGIASIRSDRKQRGVTTPLYFHSDASQGFGLLDIHVARLGIDMLTVNAGKIYGPKQVGFLWVKPSVTLQPIVRGGGQERGLRSGTENVAGVIGFAAAAEVASRKQPSEAKRIAELRDSLQKTLTTAFPEAQILGSKKRRLPGHLSISFPGLDAERLIFMLEANGVLVATGSACSANKQTASHVLSAICEDNEVIDGSLRISLGRLNDQENINRAARYIIDAVRSEYARIKK